MEAFLPQRHPLLYPYRKIIPLSPVPHAIKQSARIPPLFFCSVKCKVGASCENNKKHISGGFPNSPKATSEEKLINRVSKKSSTASQDRFSGTLTATHCPKYKQKNVNFLITTPAYTLTPKAKTPRYLRGEKIMQATRSERPINIFSARHNIFPCTWL